MAAERPSLAELFELLDASLGQVLSEDQGTSQFELRVVRRMLQTVAREVAQGADLAAQRLAGLRDLVGQDGDIDELNAILCARLHERRIRYDDPKLLAFLRATTEARLRIDNPKFQSEREVGPASRGAP